MTNNARNHRLESLDSLGKPPGEGPESKTQSHLVEGNPPRKNKPLFILSVLLLGGWIVCLAILAYLSQQ